MFASMEPINGSKRSRSVPSTSHPSINEVVEKTGKLRSSEVSSTSTSASINAGLSGLDDLYASLDSVLGLRSVQEVLLTHLEGKFLDELLDGSVKIIEVCDQSRDLLGRFKEAIQALESALRRRKGNATLENNVNGYISFRKTMRKEAKKLMVVRVKQAESRHLLQSALVEDENVAMIGYILREIDSISCSFFKSVLAFLSSSSRQSKWYFFSQFAKASNEETNEQANEVERVDSALKEKALRYEEVGEELKTLGRSIEILDIGLRSVSRRLIKTRASVLNILSQ